MNEQPKITADAVILLGMHRSGTSCLAGSLEEAGLHFGDVNRRARHNAKGNLENRAIMDLHEAVLTANDGSWDDPPERAIWSSDHKAQRDAIIATYPTGKIWGFKDPRTLLTLDGWLDALPTARCVGTFRHPLAVVRSLHTRNGFSHDKSIALWSYYNRTLLHYQSQLQFDLVCFDWPAGRYDADMSIIAAGLNLPPPSDRFSFFEPGLRKSHVHPSTNLPEEIQAIYGSLVAIASSAPDHRPEENFAPPAAGK